VPHRGGLLVRIALLLAGVAGLATAVAVLSPPAGSGLLALVAALAVGWNRWAGVGVFGPVFALDALRQTRRPGLFKLRIVYLLLVLLVLLQVYGAWRRSFPTGPPLAELGRFTLSLFYGFLAVQLVVLLVLTPAVTAGALAEERERGSMAFLLATDLRDHEVVLGKFAARLLQLLGLLLAGVPVFFLLQLLGGIDPGTVGLCFAGTALTVASAGAVALFASAVSAHTRDALILAYGLVFGYLGLAVVAEYAVRVNELTTFPSTDTWTSPVELGDVVAAANLGHPIAAMRQFAASTNGPAAVAVFRTYALFHGVVLALALGLAVLVLRRVGVAGAEPRRAAGQAVRPDRVVGDDPVRWRETRTERGLNANVWAHLVTLAAVLGSLALLDWKNVQDGKALGREVNFWCRLLTALLGSMILLQVALRGAAGLRQEHDRGTLDGLLATPLPGRAILFGKWVGCLWSVQMLVGGLIAVWLVGLATGGLHVFAVAGQVLFLAAYAAAFALVGLYVSLTTATALRATVNAVGGVMLLGFGHWLAWIFLLPTLNGPPLPGTWQSGLVSFQQLLTPPTAFGMVFGFSAYDANFAHPDARLYARLVPVALLVWVAVGWAVWRLTVRGFQRRFHRPD